LYPALVQCFGIILLGYLAGKFSFINDVEAKVSSNLSEFVKLCCGSGSRRAKITHKNRKSE
jgi:hypothetical protein